MSAITQNVDEFSQASGSPRRWRSIGGLFFGNLAAEINTDLTVQALNWGGFGVLCQGADMWSSLWTPSSQYRVPFCHTEQWIST